MKIIVCSSNTQRTNEKQFMDHQQSAAHIFRNNVAELTVKKHAKITVNLGE